MNNKRLLLSVSGGLDSMVMLYKIYQTDKNIAVVNFDHMIRTQTSKQDSKFVYEKCRQLGIDCLHFDINCPQFADQHGVSLETAGRILRHQHYKQLTKSDFYAVALAHHQTDNAESVLMHLFRGCGIKGLIGIFDHDHLIYPLINMTRAEIKDYAIKNSVLWREDETNAQNFANRNFLRNCILDKVRERYENVDKNIFGMSRRLAEIDDLILSLTPKPTLVDGVVKLNISNLSGLHIALKKSAVFSAIETINGRIDIEESHINSVLDLIFSKNNSIIDLPFGIKVVKEYENLVFIKSVTNYFESSALSLENAQVYKTPFGNFKLCISAVDTAEEYAKVRKGLVMDFDKVSQKNVIVRKREDKDIFKRFMGKTKSLSDYLTDEKIPARIRDDLLLFTVDSTVLAIVGYEISDFVKVDKSTKTILELQRA